MIMKKNNNNLPISFRKIVGRIQPSRGKKWWLMIRFK
jgi:hypothetical protein